MTFDPGANFCPDCGERRNLCQCMYQSHICPDCEGSGFAIVGFDDNPDVYENIEEYCPRCKGSGLIEQLVIRARLLISIEMTGDSLHARYAAGTLGTVEKTDVTGYDYEFYPFSQAGVCVRKNEIEILPND